MADSKGDVSITIGADATQFNAAISAAAKTLQSGVEGMKGQLGSLVGVLEKAQGAFVALAAVAAGGAAFGKAIGATTQFTGEVSKLSKQAGITTEQASALNVALGDVGSDADTWSDSLGKLTKQVKTNESGLNAMGIATRGANGEFLNGKALMDSALAGLKSYKEGTDRNLAAQTAFGRGAADVGKLLKLNAEIEDEAAKKAAALGLVVGTDNVEAVKRYKLAMNDANDVLLGIENAIGTAVMPALTRFAEWFAEGGPTAVAGFKTVLTGVGEVLSMVGEIFTELWATVRDFFSGLGSAFGDNIPTVTNWGEFVQNVFTIVKVALLTAKMAFIDTFEVLRGAIEGSIAVLKSFALMAEAAMRLDWNGVKNAWVAGMNGVADAVLAAQKRIVEQSTKTGEQLSKLLNPPAREYRASDNYGDRAVKTGGRSFTDPNSKGRLEDTSKAEYAIQKAQAEAALSLQKEMLKEEQETNQESYRKNLIDIKAYYAAKQAIEEQEIDLEIQAKQKEIDASKKAQGTAATDRERLGLRAQEITLTGQLTVLEAKRAQVAVTEGRAANDAIRQQTEALRNLHIESAVNVGNNQVVLDRIALDTRRQLRQVSDAQAIEEERGFEDRLTAIQRQALLDRRALEEQGNRDPVKIAALNDQLEQLERQHQEKLTQLDAQATIERNKYATEAAAKVQGTFESFFNDLTDRTKKLSDTFKSLGQNLLKAFNDIQSKKMAEALFGSGTSGGGMLNDWMKSLFGTGGGAKASDGPGTGGISGGGFAPGADKSAAAGADPMGDFIKNIDTANSGLTNLSSGGIGGMFKSATDWIAKQVLGTTAQATQTSVSQTMTTAFAALSEAAYSAAAALSTVGGSGSGAGGAGMFGSLLGGSGSGGAAAASSAGSSEFAVSAIAGFADGTDFVPRDMIALIHEGERITPAKFNQRDQASTTMHMTVNVPPSTSRASATQTARAVAGVTSQALRRNS